MQIAASIFKAYDIRGMVPSTINEEVAEALGKAFGTTALALGEKTVAVGRDGRLSGPSLATALMRGLAAAGVDVIDVGMVTTPMLYFAANRSAASLANSGIQVTGSHNPKDYNGFKMVLAGRAIYGDDIQALKKMMTDEAWMLPAQAGSIKPVNVEKEYRDRIVAGIKLARPMKIVIDSGNGIAGASAPEIFRALGCEVTELFSEVDGDFPNHHPDPSKPENLRDLIKALQTGDAELGLAFDGDGDRLGIVTKDGQNIFPDRQMMLFARDVLSRVPGGTILFDVKCSQRLDQIAQVFGLARVRVVVRKIAIDLAEKLGHLAAQRAKNGWRRRAGNAVTGINHDLHRPRQFDARDNAVAVVFLDIDGLNASGLRGQLPRLIGHHLFKRLNVVAINRAASQHHFEAVVVFRVVAAGNLNARIGQRSGRPVGRKVKHGRGDHADINHIHTRSSQAAHQRSRQRRPAQAPVTTDGYRFFTQRQSSRAKGLAQRLGHFFVDGSGNNPANVIGLEN